MQVEGMSGVTYIVQHQSTVEVFGSRKTKSESLNFSLALDSKPSFITESF